MKQKSSTRTKAERLQGSGGVNTCPTSVPHKKLRILTVSVLSHTKDALIQTSLTSFSSNLTLGNNRPTRRNNPYARTYIVGSSSSPLRGSRITSPINKTVECGPIRCTKQAGRLQTSVTTKANLRRACQMKSQEPRGPKRSTILSETRMAWMKYVETSAREFSSFW